MPNTTIETPNWLREMETILGGTQPSPPRESVRSESALDRITMSYSRGRRSSSHLRPPVWQAGELAN